MRYITFILILFSSVLSAQIQPYNIKLPSSQSSDSMHILMTDSAGVYQGRGRFYTIPVVAGLIEAYLSIGGADGTFLTDNLVSDQDVSHDQNSNDVIIRDIGTGRWVWDQSTDLSTGYMKYDADSLYSLHIEGDRYAQMLLTNNITSTFSATVEDGIGGNGNLFISSNNVVLETEDAGIEISKDVAGDIHMDASSGGYKLMTKPPYANAIRTVIGYDSTNNYLRLNTQHLLFSDTTSTIATQHDISGFLSAEVDGSVSNEGSLTVEAGSSTSSEIHSNTSGSTDVTLNAGWGLDISENTGTGNITYIADSSEVATQYDLTQVTGTADHDWYESGGTSPPNAITDNQFHTGDVAIGADGPYGAKLSVSGDGTADRPLDLIWDLDQPYLRFLAQESPEFSWTWYYADGAELQLHNIHSGGAATIPFQVQGAAPTGSLNIEPDGDVIIGDYPNSRDDGSPTNILGTSGTGVIQSYPVADVQVATDLTIGGAGPTYTIESSTGTDVTIQGAGINTLSESPANTLVITATEVDGSTSNELQTLTNTSAATTHTVTLSNSGGSLQLAEGSNITLTTTGTGADGVVTIASTASGSSSPYTISPAQITSDQDNYAPTGIGIASYVFIDCDSDMHAITGIADSTAGTLEKTIVNDGSYMIYFPMDHPDSDAAHRFKGWPGDFYLYPGHSVKILYDISATRWRIVGSDGGYTRPTVYYSWSAGSATAGDYGDLALVNISGSATATASTTSLPACLQLTTDAASTNGYLVYLAKSVVTYSAFASAHQFAEAVISIPTLSDGTQTFSVNVAITATPTNTALEQNNSVGIRYSNGVNGGEWELFSQDNAAAEDVADSNIPVVAATMYKLRIEIDKSKSEARGYINGTYIGKVETQMPNSVVNGARVILLKSLGATSRALNLHSFNAGAIY